MSKHTETGAGKGRGPNPQKRVYNPEELADAVVERVVSGRMPTETTSGAITPQDKQVLTRIAQVPVDEFNEMVATRLRTIGHKALTRIEENLDAGTFKTGELGFIYSVAHDKRLSLDGSRALQQAAVNIQVNNFGAPSKAALLDELDGLKRVSPPNPTQTPSPPTNPHQTQPQ